jgi:hypothetical protein
MAGKSVGPLAGVPVGIKDLVYTKGIKATSGSIIYKDFVPTEDDVVIERLHESRSRKPQKLKALPFPLQMFSACLELGHCSKQRPLCVCARSGLRIFV